MPNSESIKCELAVIGAGMAGMACGLFAANRGLPTVLVGRSGEIIFASGLLDLMGVHPLSEKHLWLDPWEGIDALVRDIPNHPYARLKKEDIRAAFDELLFFLQNAGVPYYRLMNRNAVVLTSLGTVKPTYCVPQTMWEGVVALEEKRPCLLVDIRGLRGFSAQLIADTLRDKWQNLRTARISFPGTASGNEVYTEHMANALVLSKNRERLAQVVRPLVKDAQIVGMPAILGLYQTSRVIVDLEKLIGVPVFEIPTIPPSVPGLRLKEAFERGLRSKGIKYFSQKRVLEVNRKAGGDFELSVGGETTERTVESKGVILASGRFIGGGLHADRKRIRETIFDLPVRQPENRTKWHHENLLEPRGHPINRAGLEIDDTFRPLDRNGRPAFNTLFAAGSILAHQDWKRMKCGAGLAIATAFGAVKSFFRLCQ
ncbi:MAG: glycerol-3-phosphate dehydrogenase subunit GlpB [Desulfobacteraceae bacterium]|nr:MAG: glycerol-3-phosphate dehydrogenase subunit GlpB [Desulfobacteraceae bacterium]